jgi:hypothetical protein
MACRYRSNSRRASRVRRASQFSSIIMSASLRIVTRHSVRRRVSSGHYVVGSLLAHRHSTLPPAHVTDMPSPQAGRRLRRGTSVSAIISSLHTVIDLPPSFTSAFAAGSSFRVAAFDHSNIRNRLMSRPVSQRRTTHGELPEAPCPLAATPGRIIRPRRRVGATPARVFPAARDILRLGMRLGHD